MSNQEEKDILEHNWYEVLSISYGDSEQVISKAIRKLSLKYHPDKNTTDAKAPELFLLIQRAKDVLLDPAKRKIFDDHILSIQKRKEYDSKRSKSMNETRKKMKEDLENRMKEAMTATSSKEPSRSSTKQSEKEFSSRQKTENERFRDEVDQTHEMRRGMDERIAKDRQIHQIKIKWRKSQESHTDDSLYQLFERFGEIEFIDVSAHSAIITFAEGKACHLAVNAFVGSPDLRVSIVESSYIPKGKPKIFTHNYASDTTTTMKQPPIPTSIESLLADDIKRAVEREKYLRQLEKDSEHEDDLLTPMDIDDSGSSVRDHDSKSTMRIFDSNIIVTDEEIAELERIAFGHI
jgi:curved DNA-binding protein CbpA